ncbi:MAG: RusA family crossover junction endodeoxyribonuclease [Clostridia bacterium]
MKYTVEIPMKLPSLNKYINECRKNKYAGANMKKSVENDMAIFINLLPSFNKPLKITFKWIENNKKRDLDNICSAKKFILDCLVKTGKIQDDNRKIITGFKDEFYYADEAKVILEIEEVSKC